MTTTNTWKCPDCGHGANFTHRGCNISGTPPVQPDDREIKRKINARLKGEFFAIGIRKGYLTHEACEGIIAAIARGEFPELTITYPTQGEKA